MQHLYDPILSFFKMAASSDVCLTEEDRNLNFSICNAINDLDEKKTRADFNNVTKQLDVDIETITVALEYLCATGTKC